MSCFSFFPPCLFYLFWSFIRWMNARILYLRAQQRKSEKKEMSNKNIACKILNSVVSDQVHQTYAIFDTPYYAEMVSCVNDPLILKSSVHFHRLCAVGSVRMLYFKPSYKVDTTHLVNDNQPSAEKKISNTIQQTTSFSKPNKRQTSRKRERESENRKVKRKKASRIKVNKIRCHIKMLWHFASDLCVCVEHIDYGNKNRWIKCRQQYAIRTLRKTNNRHCSYSTSIKEQQEMIFSQRLVNGFNADEMKNQNVNNNKAPDKNLWHVSCESSTFTSNR